MFSVSVCQFIRHDSFLSVPEDLLPLFHPAVDNFIATFVLYSCVLMGLVTTLVSLQDYYYYCYESRRLQLGCQLVSERGPEKHNNENN